MLRLKIILIVFLLIQLTINQKPNDFCAKFEKECKQSHASKNKTICKKIACYGEYRFECGNDYCASDLKMCKKFQKMRFKINYFALPNLKEISKYKNLIKRIAHCSQKNNDLKLENFCLTGCLNKTSCKCGGKYVNLCGDLFCSKDIKSCDYLIKKNLTDSIKKSIKFCEIY